MTYKLDDIHKYRNKRKQKIYDLSDVFPAYFTSFFFETKTPLAYIRKQIR
jgi:hypothetical protein